MFKREITHVIFFDIEYYVPEEHRNRPGLKANPYMDGSFVIGGVFQRYFPVEDRLEEKEEFWIWDMKGRDTTEQEKNLLEKIYLYFRESWTRWELLGGDPRLTEPIVAGFGITRLDIPVLFARSQIHRIAEPERLYDTYFKLRHFDLSVTSAPMIPEQEPECARPGISELGCQEPSQRRGKKAERHNSMGALRRGRSQGHKGKNPGGG